MIVGRKMIFGGAPNPLLWTVQGGAPLLVKSWFLIPVELHVGSS